jgi:hypothetical protein
MPRSSRIKDTRGVAGMLNYLKKFALDILPSVAATIIGAYIVNHYIAAKPGADAPVAAAVSAAEPKADAGPAVGVKAKGISEKSIMEKTAAEQPTVVEKSPEKAEAKVDAKSADAKSADVKSADAPVETASIPADPRRHQVAPREKVRVILPSPVQPAASAVAPVVTTPNPAPPVEAAAVPEERRDANDLARAAIERLRGNGEAAPRVQEAARAPEANRAVTLPVVSAPTLRPLPPPIMVSAPPADSYGQGSQPARPPYAANSRTADPRVIDPSRPTPPAEIPVSRPLDLRAEVAEPSVRERTTAVAEDMLSTAKSLFHSVLPK